MADEQKNDTSICPKDIGGEIKLPVTEAAGNRDVAGQSDETGVEAKDETNTRNGDPKELWKVGTNADGESELVFTLPLDSDGGEFDDNELIQELTNALSQFLDESDGNAKLAIDYIVGITEGKQKISTSRTIEELESAVIENIVLPLARSASSLPNPNDAVSSLMMIDDKVFVDEIDSVRNSGIADEGIDFDALDFSRMKDKFISLCAAGVGDAATDAALNDVVRYHRQKEQGNLPDIPRIKFGFFKKLKMAHNVLKKQANMLRTMIKQAHNKHDIEIWYSRYALAAPIEFAKEEGFIMSLAQAAVTSDAVIRQDCAQIAQAMGFECNSWDIDYARVAQGMRTFCVNKTGYSYPENWLYAVTSKWEMDDKKLI